MNISRRNILAGTAGAAAVTSAFVVSSARINHPEHTQYQRSFYGKHQAGIIDDAQPFACFIAYDIVSTTTTELEELFRALSNRCAILMEGGTPTPVGISSPPTDSGTLGPEITPDNLSITIGVGNSLFNHRYGLAPLRPKYLTSMPTFANDDLRRESCHGDILVQIRANNIDTVLHALRDINRHTRRSMQIRWQQDGFISPPRPNGTSRNHFGFKDGISNPDAHNSELAMKYIWAADDDLPWTHGGTYQVVRLIAMLTEFWDRISISEQESLIGRTRDSGAPLDGNSENDIPRYSDDPLGAAIPLNSHIRLANPRNSHSNESVILRKSYNFSNGTLINGNLDLGLIFTCFQQNIAQQFETIQLRLKDEPLVDYVTPYGGGYFFTLPGVQDSSKFLGHNLFVK